MNVGLITLMNLYSRRDIETCKIYLKNEHSEASQTGAEFRSKKVQVFWSVSTIL